MPVCFLIQYTLSFYVRHLVLTHASFRGVHTELFTCSPLSFFPSTLPPSLPSPCCRQNSCSNFVSFVENMNTFWVCDNKIIDSCVWKRPAESSSVDAHLPRTQGGSYNQHLFGSCFVPLTLGAGNTPNKQKLCPHRAYIRVNTSVHMEYFHVKLMDILQ